MNKIALIYMGGTFGCVGQPLSPMPEAEFIVWLNNVIPKHFNVDCLAAAKIKDSSSCHAADWLSLVQQIQDLTPDYQHFVVIHGTDTLSYAAATLARFLQNSVHLIVTGSQYPLLHPEAMALGQNSDAMGNLIDALQQVTSVDAGVYVAFDQQLIYAASSLKYHTTDLNAFRGQLYNSEINQHYQPAFQVKAQHLQLAKQLNIQSWMLQPLAPDLFAENLKQLLQQPPHFLILQGFGTGNIGINDLVLARLQELRQLDCVVILTTQVTQGQLDQRYAVSQWVLEAEIIISDCLGHADLYAKILKMYLKYGTPELCAAHWYNQ